MMKCTGKPVLLISLMICLLCACSGGYRAPVSDAGDGPLFWDTGRMHRVNQGETLYIISLIYDIDYRLIAQVNNLTDPYTIYAGQEILVDVRGVTLEPARTQTTARTSPVITSPPIRSSSLPGQSIPLPAPQTAPQTVPQPAPQPATEPVRATPVPAPPVVNTVVSSWVWPAQGDLVGRYSVGDNGNKGIDISGKKGDDIVAAAAGEVVYAGSAILGYGDLLIIKHNEQFLTAYAHNDRLLVAEGNQVSQGQKIAEMGSTGTDRVILHFEIRRSGKPEDPLGYLP